MTEETKKVLELLAAGTINAEEAERLLDKLGSGESRGPVKAQGIAPRTVPDEGSSTAGDGQERRALPSYLRVLVEGEDGETVNIRIPLKLIRTGIRLGAMLPTDAREKLEEKGIDLASFGEMNADELIEALNDLQVDVDGKGEKVRIFCE